MRTRTIMRAFMEASDRAASDRHDWDGSELRGANHRYEQAEAFRKELIRRMDERDALKVEVEARRLVMAEQERIANMPRSFSWGGLGEVTHATHRDT